MEPLVLFLFVNDNFSLKQFLKSQSFNLLGWVLHKNPSWKDWPNFMRSVKKRASREQNQTRLVSAEAQPILLKFCGLFRGNSVQPCSITMPATFAPEKVIHQRQRGNVTSENHHGGFLYQFLSRQVERQNQRRSKEGSPTTGVSLLTDEKDPIQSFLESTVF